MQLQPVSIDPSTPGLASDQRNHVPDRDLVLDLLRGGSLLVVVLWHWVFSTVRWSGDGPHVGNPVGSTPGMWLLTWVGQVMPLFFMVGGALHARSLERSDPSGFRRRRLRRLLPPALPLVALAAFALLIAVGLGRQDWTRAVVLVVSPLWFLATYLLCVLVAPWAQRVHRSVGAAGVLIGVAAAVALDRLRIGAGVEGPLVTAASFAVVWLTVHQLGWFVGSLRTARRRVHWLLLAFGVGALCCFSWLGPYPATMVGVPGERLSNLGPPTVMVIWLALAQLALVSLLHGRLHAFASRLERSLARAGQWSMTVYVWHLAAFAIFWLLVASAGLATTSEVDAAWWIQRPLWLVGPLVIAIPLCTLTRRFDRAAHMSADERVARRS